MSVVPIRGSAPAARKLDHALATQQAVAIAPVVAIAVIAASVVGLARDPGAEARRQEGRAVVLEFTPADMARVERRAASARSIPFSGSLAPVVQTDGQVQGRRARSRGCSCAKARPSRPASSSPRSTRRTCNRALDAQAAALEEAKARLDDRGQEPRQQPGAAAPEVHLAERLRHDREHVTTRAAASMRSPRRSCASRSKALERRRGARAHRRHRRHPQDATRAKRSASTARSSRSSTWAAWRSRRPRPPPRFRPSRWGRSASSASTASPTASSKATSSASIRTARAGFARDHALHLGAQSRRRAEGRHVRQGRDRARPHRAGHRGPGHRGPRGEPARPSCSRSKNGKIARRAGEAGQRRASRGRGRGRAAASTTA